MKKLILALLIAICALCTALGIAACVPGDLKAHNYTREWSHSFTEHWHECSDPGCQSKKSLAAHDWRLVESMVETEPTCGDAGWGRYVCVMCGATKDDVIPATGDHSYSLFEKIVEPTCEEAGQELLLCETCGSLVSRDIPPVAHSYSEGWEYTADGHYHTCKWCGTPGEIIPHDAKENITPSSQQPYGKNDGYTRYVCTCGYVVYEEKIENPSVAATFNITIRRNYDSRNITVAESDEEDVNGRPVLRAVFWAENTYPGALTGDIGNAGRFVISVGDAYTKNGGRANLECGSNAGMEMFSVDGFTGEERSMERSLNDNYLMGRGYNGYYYNAADGDHPTFALGIRNYDSTNAQNNLHIFVLRYYTGSGANRVVRAERTLEITVKPYGESAEPVSLPRQTAYIESKRRAA